MTPIQQCLQSLAVLAKTDDLNGISLAESMIDEFVRTAGTESAWQIVALDDLKHEITDRGWGTPCSGRILDYIARQRAAIAAKCEPLNDRPPQIAPAQPEGGGDLGQVPPDLDQTFSSVLQAQAELIQSAAELGVLHSYNQTPKQMLEEFEKLDPQGNIDRTFARLAAEAPAVKQA